MEKNVAKPRLEPMISRSEVSRTNYYSIGHLFEIQQIYLCMLHVHCDETKSESWPVRVLVSVLPE